MANEKHDPWALLREAREELGRHKFNQESPACVLCGGESGFDAGRECLEAHDYALATRIDAALAAHDSVPPSEDKAESDLWWSPSSHRASQGKCDLHVWRMSLKEWGWSTTVYRDHERGREDLGSGVCNTLDEAQRAAIAAARRMR